MVEILEVRIAPATFVNPFLVRYIEPDGDTVEVSSSVPTFGKNLREFQFETSGDGAHLLNLDLRASAVGGRIKIAVVEQGSEGDGVVDVDSITTEVDLGQVRVDGRLGRIEAGDADRATPGLGKLRVEKLGLSSSGEVETPSELQSTLRGDVAKVKVLHDIDGARVSVIGSIGVVEVGGSLIGRPSGGQIFASVSIGSISIQGDVRGGDADNSGRILAGYSLDNVEIGGSVSGGVGRDSGVIVTPNLGKVVVKGDLEGGSGGSSGVIRSRFVQSLELLGSVIGGAGYASGGVSSSESAYLGPSIRPGTSLGESIIESIIIRGSVLGGTGENSGQVFLRHSTNDLRIFGSIIGGTGSTSGVVLGTDSGSVLVSGDVAGGSGIDSGTLMSQHVGSLEIGGSIIGGQSLDSGTVFVGFSAGTIRVGGDVVGSTGQSSGVLYAQDTPSIKIAGKVTGGAGNGSGVVKARFVDVVTIGGDVVGGEGQSSGSIRTAQVAKLTLNGSLIGASGLDSGIISAIKFGAVRISGDIQGGSAPGGSDERGKLHGSGIVLGKQGLVSIEVGGSLIGGSGKVSGAIISGGMLGSATLQGNVVGGDASQTGILEATKLGTVTIHGNIERTRTDIASPGDVRISGGITGKSADRVHVGGNVSAADLSFETSPQTAYAINFRKRVELLSIDGSILGNENNRVGIAAGFFSTGTRGGLGSINIGGDVAFAEISASFQRAATGLEFTRSNPDARIGTLTVGGDWIASSVSAGVEPGQDGYFGTDDDRFVLPEGEQTPAVSAIAKIIIAGSVSGTTEIGDHFGFVAGQIGSISIAGEKVSLRPGQIDVVELSASTDDVTLREISQE